MSAPKHTPAPWRIYCEQAPSGVALYSVRSADKILMMPTSGAKAHADAHIIAAAPELLDLVEVMLEDLEGATQGDVDHIDKHGTRRKAKALIAKARGTNV